MLGNETLRHVESLDLVQFCNLPIRRQAVAPADDHVVLDGLNKCWARGDTENSSLTSSVSLGCKVPLLGVRYRKSKRIGSRSQGREYYSERPKFSLGSESDSLPGEISAVLHLKRKNGSLCIVQRAARRRFASARCYSITGARPDRSS